MNVIADLIIFGLIFILLLTVFVVGTEGTIPMFKRVEFDDACDKYLRQMSINRGLFSDDITDLRNNLISLGFQSITITAPADVDWGSEGKLLVEAYYEVEQTDKNLSKSSVSKKITYENSTIVMGLEN